MPTSGTTAWSLTARDIITAALEENNVIPLGRDPKAKELDACILRLNGLLKSWAVGMHQEALADVAVVADAASVALDAEVESILSLRLVTSATSERPLVRIPRDRYLELPNKAQSGTPTMFYESQATDGVTIYLWPVPTTDTTLKANYLRKPETVTNASETVDFPQRWQEALFTNLAMRCAGIFGIQPGPELITRAQRLEREMLDADRPESYFMEPAGCRHWHW